MMMATMSVTMAKVSMVRLIMALQWRRPRDRNDALVGSFSARFITTMVKMMIFKCLEEDHDHDHADHFITWFLQAT